jgi:hypothetical protein
VDRSSGPGRAQRKSTASERDLRYATHQHEDAASHEP